MIMIGSVPKMYTRDHISTDYITGKLTFQYIDELPEDVEDQMTKVIVNRIDIDYSTNNGVKANITERPQEEDIESITKLDMHTTSLSGSSNPMICQQLSIEHYSKDSEEQQGLGPV